MPDETTHDRETAPDSPSTTSTSKTPATAWIGRGLSTLVCLLLAASAAGKVAGGETAEERMNHIGSPASLNTTLLGIELVCLVAYAFPQTAVVGAILVTGYFGGAIFAHLRVGDAPVIQTIVPLVAWLGLFLREPRLRRLIPLRR